MTLALRPLWLVSAALILAGNAHAEPKADLNQDGKISQAEFMEAANQKFILSDLNRDNFISQDERSQFRENRVQEYQLKRFDQFDLNGDGVVTRSEFEQQAGQRRDTIRDRLDINQDGIIDKTDRDQRRDKMRERREEFRKQTADRRAPRINPDANGDGLISRAEHEASVRAMFERLDANQDGFLEKGEGKRRHKRRMRRRF